MTNQEAIGIIKTAIAQVEWDYPMDYAAAFDMAVEALTKDNNAPGNGWISVKDRPPEEEETYLVFRKEPFGAVTMAWYSGNENGWLALDGSFYADGVVTHYMPLPEPPKEET